MKIRKISLAILLLTLLCTFAFATPSLHWSGLGSGIGGYYNNPPTSGVGYGEVYPHGNWSCEIVFDSVYNLPGYADGSPLVTMCVEWNEALIGENNFNAVINLGAVNGGKDGTGYDPLNTESAWLFNEYLNGNTFGITNVNHRVAAVQEAIWSFEGELDAGWSLYSETPGIKQLAINAVSGGWTNTNIRVLNIYWQSNGQNGQDALCRIPEPASVLLIGLGAFFGFRKRK